MRKVGAASTARPKSGRHLPQPAMSRPIPPARQAAEALPSSSDQESRVPGSLLWSCSLALGLLEGVDRLDRYVTVTLVLQRHRRQLVNERLDLQGAQLSTAFDLGQDR